MKWGGGTYSSYLILIDPTVEARGLWARACHVQSLQSNFSKFLSILISNIYVFLFTSFGWFGLKKKIEGCMIATLLWSNNNALDHRYSFIYLLQKKIDFYYFFIGLVIYLLVGYDS